MSAVLEYEYEEYEVIKDRKPTNLSKNFNAHCINGRSYKSDEDNKLLQDFQSILNHQLLIIKECKKFWES